MTSRISKSFLNAERRLRCLALTSLLVGLPSAAYAVEPAKETVPGGALMLGAYILIWGLPLSFLWFNNKRLSSLEGELKELRGLLDKAGSQGAAGTPTEDDAE